MTVGRIMIRFRILDKCIAALATVDSVAGLRQVLITVKADMGFDYMALTHHADIFDNIGRVIRIHDYPEIWVHQFDRRKLGRTDPVHRASHTQAKPFRWTEVSRMIQMRQEDWEIIKAAKDCDIGDGYTVPIHVPGESSGSVSFAMAVGRPLPEEMLSIIPEIAMHAFDCARRLWRMRPPPLAMPILTPCQTRALIWTMRGKTDREAGQIENRSPSTMKKHVTHSLMRYNVEKRTLLMIRTLLDGTLSLGDLHDN